MNGDEVTALLIILMVLVAGTLRSLAKNGAFTRAGLAHPDGETARLAEEVRLLRDRVQVLERVITDTHQSARLDQQIDALRHR